MAVFAEDGKLILIDTLDLMDTLDEYDGAEVINMNNRSSCLGQRTIARLIANDRAEVRYDVHEGAVETAEGTYTVAATDGAGDYIQAMIDRQLDGPHDDEYFGIEVCELRDELQAYLDKNVYYASLRD